MSVCSSLDGLHLLDNRRWRHQVGLICMFEPTAHFSPQIQLQLFSKLRKLKNIIHVFHSRTEYRVKSSWRILLEKSFSLYLTGTLGSRTFMYLGLQVASSLKSLSCPLRSIRTTKSLLLTSCFYPTMLLLLIKVFMLGFVREAWSRKQALERCQDKHVIYWQKEKKGKALKQELEPGI